jgi:hypothetical protein
LQHLGPLLGIGVEVNESNEDDFVSQGSEKDPVGELLEVPFPM